MAVIPILDRSSTFARLAPLHERTHPCDAFGRQDFGKIISALEGGNTGRQGDPGHGLGGEDHRIGAKGARIIERADAKAKAQPAQAGIVAPQGDAAVRAAHDLVWAAAA